MNHIQLLAHSLAARIPAMAQDCAINNAHMIEKEIEAALAEELRDRDVLILKLDGQLQALLSGRISPSELSETSN